MAEAQVGPMRDVLDSVRRLSDEELIAQVRSLAARERREATLLVAHLAELGARELHLRAGYSSLFVYCRDALALSEHDSYNRIEVARTARRFPAVLELLACGAVNLTTVRLLGPHLTPENHESVLQSARGKRRAEVEEIVARLLPFPEAPAFVRKLPTPRAVLPTPAPRERCSLHAPAAASPPDAAESPEATEDAAGAAASAAGSTWAGSSFPRPRPSGEITPLAPDRYRLQVTIDGATLEKLRLAKDMLRHANPTGDDAAILDRALTALLAELTRAKFAATPRPGPARPSAAGSRHVPAEVKRSVWLRDLGRCAFVGADGRRCGERGFVEFHHVRPYSAGGEPTVENIQLRCRRHNAYEARVFFAAAKREGLEHH